MPMIVRVDQALQNVDISLGAVSGKVLPDELLYGAVEPLHHCSLLIAFSGEVLDALLPEKCADFLVEELLTFVGLEPLGFAWACAPHKQFHGR